MTLASYINDSFLSVTKANNFAARQQMSHELSLRKQRLTSHTHHAQEWWMQVKQKESENVCSRWNVGSAMLTCLWFFPTVTLPFLCWMLQGNFKLPTHLPCMKAQQAFIPSDISSPHVGKQWSQKVLENETLCMIVSLCIFFLLFTKKFKRGRNVIFVKWIMHCMLMHRAF